MDYGERSIFVSYQRLKLRHAYICCTASEYPDEVDDVKLFST